MDRREALSATAWLVGGAIVGGPAFLAGCKRSSPATTQELFQAGDVLLLDEVGETIIPTTPDSPGAKAARIGAFMTLIVTDCYEEKEQKAFTEGLKALQGTSEDLFGKEFMKLSPDERQELLARLDKEARRHENVI